jgi:peptidoglycan/xylan/chitin deacetylase (PgdA/CDA1 family)
MIGSRAFRLLAPRGRQARLTSFIFHRIRPERDPLFPGEPDAEEFERKMIWVRRWFNVLPAPDAVRRLRVGDLPERALCLTFDDGYADNFTVALPILERLGLHATFFIATRFLDGGRMWNDSVIESVRRCDSSWLDLSELGFGAHSLESAVARRQAIDALLSRLKYLSSDEREERVAAIVARTKSRLPTDLMMSSDDVRSLHDAGMTIGAHTHSHPILARLDPANAEREIASGKERLEAIVAQPVTLFAYPNGQPRTDYRVEHVQLVKAMGFEAAFSTAWGVASVGSDMFQLPRYTPWGQNRWKFGFRLAQNLMRTEAAYA